jgi:hypothetical protein
MTARNTVSEIDPVLAAFADVGWQGQARAMASRRIVDGLLDAVFDAFGPVDPGKVMGGQLFGGRAVWCSA